jgi:hypothetical protein
MVSITLSCSAILQCYSAHIVATIPVLRVHHSGRTADKDEQLSQGHLGCC